MDSQNFKYLQNSSIKLNGGTEIPIIGYGTFQLKGNDCKQGVKIALRAGYRHIDSASIYRNSKDINVSLKELFDEKKEFKREEIFITSKISPNQQGYENTIGACNTLLQELGVEYIDLLIIHWPGVGQLKPDDPKTPEIRLETWKALEFLKEKGLVKNIGVSNFLVHHLQHLLKNCKIPPMINQFEIHPLCFNEKLINFCRENKIAIQAYSPLARRHQKFINNPILIKLSQKYQQTLAQISLRWTIQHGFITLPKSKTEKYIKENFDIFDFELSQSDMLEINKLNQNIHTCWNPDVVQY